MDSCCSPLSTSRWDSSSPIIAARPHSRISVSGTPFICRHVMQTQSGTILGFTMSGIHVVMSIIAVHDVLFRQYTGQVPLFPCTPRAVIVPGEQSTLYTTLFDSVPSSSHRGLSTKLLPPLGIVCASAGGGDVMARWGVWWWWRRVACRLSKTRINISGFVDPQHVFYEL